MRNLSYDASMHDWRCQRIAGMRLIATLTCMVLGFAAAPALAQTYPNKPIRLLVGYPPGGSVDASARVVAERLGPLVVAERLGPLVGHTV